jgi:hypothetical protein
MTHGSLSTPSPREQRVDASFSTSAAAAEPRGTLHAPPPPAEGAASAAGSAPSSAPRGARARGGGRPRAIALERRRKSPCRLADARTGRPCGRRRRGRVARPQDHAHAASLGGLQLGGGRLGGHLANIQLEIIAPTLLVRRGGHVRDRRGRRRGQNSARVRTRRRLRGPRARWSAEPRPEHLRFSRDAPSCSQRRGGCRPRAPGRRYRCARARILQARVFAARRAAILPRGDPASRELPRLHTGVALSWAPSYRPRYRYKPRPKI